MVADVRDVALWGEDIIVLHGPDEDDVTLSIFSPVEEGVAREQ